MLSVKEDSSAAEIRKAYRQLAQKWHPDKHPNDRAKAERYFKIISQAFEVLSDEAARSRYDASLHQKRNADQGRKQEQYTPPPKSHHDLMAEAWEIGKYSREHSFPTDSCPYKGVYASAWMEGYKAGTPPRPKHEQQPPKEPSGPIPKESGLTNMIAIVVVGGLAALAAAVFVLHGLR